MTIDGFVLSVISSATVSGLLAAALIWLFRSWLSERLKNSITHEYEQKVQTHKAQLKADHDIALVELRSSIEREAALQLAADAAFAAGQRAAMERKLVAIDELWDAVLFLRNNSPGVLTFIDVLTVDEYKNVSIHPTFRQLAGDLSEEKIFALAGGKDGRIEKVRPYVGEYLLSLFYAYQAIILRIAFLLYYGQTDQEKIEWFRDGGIKRLISVALSKEEITNFDSMQFGKIFWLRRLIESKILAGINKVISGEAFSAEALQQAQRIAEASASLNRGEKRSHLKF